MQQTSLTRVAHDVLSKPNGNIQSRYASRINPTTFAKPVYNGPFKMTKQVIDDVHSVKISAGPVLLGSGNVEIDETVITLNDDDYGIKSAGTYYIYLAMYSRKVVGGETVYWEYRASQTIPKIQQENIEGGNRWVYPFIIGTATIVTEGTEELTFSVTSTSQWQWGAHHVAGVLS